MLEGKNKRMIDQLESYGLENDRSLRNVSDLTPAHLETYTQERKKEPGRGNFSLDDARDDILVQHKEWQEGKGVSEAFGNLMDEVRREDKKSSLYNHSNDSAKTLVNDWNSSTDTPYNGVSDKKRSNMLAADDGSKSKGGYIRLRIYKIMGKKRSKINIWR